MKYHSHPVFVSLLDAIAYHQVRHEDKADRLFHTVYLYDLVMRLCETVEEELNTERRKEQMVFPVQKTYEIEGVTFIQIEVNNDLYWTWNYNG
jgi:hypothetical protein